MFRFTGKEIRDLIISFIVIALGFTILYSNGDYSHVTLIFPVVMIGVGAGFIFHELGHKFVAMHYGYYAEYELWPTGLLIALVSSFLQYYNVILYNRSNIAYGKRQKRKQNIRQLQAEDGAYADLCDRHPYLHTCARFF